MVEFIELILISGAIGLLFKAIGLHIINYETKIAYTKNV